MLLHEQTNVTRENFVEMFLKIFNLISFHSNNDNDFLVYTFET